MENYWLVIDFQLRSQLLHHQEREHDFFLVFINDLDLNILSAMH